MLWMSLTTLGSLEVLIILLNVRTDQVVEEEYADIYSLFHYPLVGIAITLLPGSLGPYRRV